MPAPNQHLITHLDRVEILYLILVAFTVAILTWLGFAEFGWIIGFVAILGLLTPAIYKSFLEASEYVFYHPWRKWLLTIWPAGILAIIYIIGLFFHVTETHWIEESAFQVFTAPVNSWIPIQTAWEETLSAQGGFISLFLITSLLLFIPRSKLFFERLMQALFINNTLLCTVYLFSKLLEYNTVFNELPIGLPANLTDSDAWTGYLILWILSLWGHFLSHLRFRSSDQRFLTNPRWVIPATVLAVCCTLFNATAWTHLWICNAVGFALIHYGRLLKRSSRRHGARKKRIWIAVYLLAIACIIAGIGSGIGVFRGVNETLKMSQQYSVDTTLQQASLEASFRMISERPFLGWGINSFQIVAHYFTEPQNATLQEPASDLIMHILEFGLFGLLLLIWIPAFQIQKYFRKRKRNSVTDYALIALFMSCAYGIGALPTVNPAYTCLWLIILFSGIRWADLNFEEELREKNYQKNVKVVPAGPNSIPSNRVLPL